MSNIEVILETLESIYAEVYQTFMGKYDAHKILNLPKWRASWKVKQMVMNHIAFQDYLSARIQCCKDVLKDKESNQKTLDECFTIEKIQERLSALEMKMAYDQAPMMDENGLKDEGEKDEN